jgi:hypothetical protein
MIKNNTTELQNILNTINNLPEAGSGGALPALTNEGTAADLLSGKQLIDSDGEVVTGTIPTKTSSNLTASGATVTVPAGYYASQATKSVATATQATPSVSIDANGKITASATQTAGYVSAGTKTGTKQLTTQAAKTITPSTSSQTAVAKNVYTTGAVTVAAIPSKYEDVGTETNAYTTKLASLETAVAALETELAGKASGGSSGSIPTYTLTIESDNGVYCGHACTVFRDGAIAAESTVDIFSDAYTTPHTIENVVCNSLIAISPSYDIPGFSITNGSLSVATGTSAVRLYIISATGGSNVTLRIYDND